MESVVLERGGQRIFDGLSLSLNEARIGIIGDNGAGKSSLLRLIAGLDRPKAGVVRVHGLDSVTEFRSLSRKVALMFQNPDDQIICPTVEEELGFTLSAHGLTRKQARAGARDFLFAHGMQDWATRSVAELSQGQRQMICLLALQIGKPLTLLLDEPFASLDLLSQHRLAQKILASGQQLIFSTHVLEQVLEFDRVLWIEKGSVRCDGPGRQVCEAYRRNVHDRVRSVDETATA